MNFNGFKQAAVLCLIAGFISIFIDGSIGWLIYGISFLIIAILAFLDIKQENDALNTEGEMEDKK